MSDRYPLPRLEKWPEEPAGGWWVLNGEEIIFRCPKCHQNGGVPLHSIDSSGEINASLLCDCGFHEFGILLDWPPNWTKAAGEKMVREAS
jgi:hypothetical protein